MLAKFDHLSDNKEMKRPHFAAAHRGAINTSYTPNHSADGGH